MYLHQYCGVRSAEEVTLEHSEIIKIIYDQ